MLKKRIKMAGMSIIEVMIAIAMLLFVSYATLMVLSSGMSTTIYLSKKVDLVDELDYRVSEYIISNSFDGTASGSSSFVKTDITNEGYNGVGYGNSSTTGNQSGGTTGNSTGVDYNLYQFTATNSDNGITINQKSFEVN